MSRRLIKNNRVDMMAGCLEIPLMPVSMTINREKKTVDMPEAEERVSQTKARLDEMIRKAEVQAEGLIRQAREQAETIRTQARQEGYRAGLQEGKQSGYRAGYEEALQSMKEMEEQARTLLQNAHREYRDYIGRTSSEIIRMAAAIAKKIIHINIDMNDECIAEIVRDALHWAEEKKQILMRSPAQFVPALQANCFQFEKICPNAAFVILEDPTIKGCGCIIETEDQVINLDIDQQLENIVNALHTLEKL